MNVFQVAVRLQISSQTATSSGDIRAFGKRNWFCFTSLLCTVILGFWLNYGLLFRGISYGFAGRFWQFCCYTTHKKHNKSQCSFIFGSFTLLWVKKLVFLLFLCKCMIPGTKCQEQWLHLIHQYSHTNRIFQTWHIPILRTTKKVGKYIFHEMQCVTAWIKQYSLANFFSTLEGLTLDGWVSKTQGQDLISSVL